MKRRKNVVYKQVASVEAYQKIFRGPDGEKVLFDLMEKHWVLNSTKAGGVDTNEMSFREGERNVVLRIMALLKIDPKQLRERIEANAKDMEQ